MITRASAPVEGLGFPDARVMQVRIARPTNQLEKAVAFYRDGLGLRELDRFEGHEGYSGVMLGLPGLNYHLEFTERNGGHPCPAPDKDSLIVLYIPDRDDFSRVRSRFEELGHSAVEREKPCWSGASVTFEGPDGWRLVLSRNPVRAR